ncbi:7467_t:CDS:1, partial [Funneliformis geosporum]
MEQKVGSQQGVKFLLYFAVMSVFLRTSLSGPAIISPQHNIHFETLVGSSEPSTFDLTSKDEENPAIYHQVALSSMDNTGVVLA